MLVITLGDPFSINIELLSKLLGQIPPELKVVLIGDWGQWIYQAPKKFHKIDQMRSWIDISPGLNFL